MQEKEMTVVVNPQKPSPGKKVKDAVATIRKSKIPGFILLLILVSGVFAGSYLVQQNQDVRERAMEEEPITPPTNPTATPITPPITSKQGDINEDGVVNIQDYQLLSNSFGRASGQDGYDARTDLNSDNVVNIQDYQLLSNNFGR